MQIYSFSSPPANNVIVIVQSIERARLRTLVCPDSKNPTERGRQDTIRPGGTRAEAGQGTLARLAC